MNKIRPVTLSSILLNYLATVAILSNMMVVDFASILIYTINYVKHPRCLFYLLAENVKRFCEYFIALVTLKAYTME